MTRAATHVQMADVAREAGVARVTVSRVINAPDSVAPETRTTVLAAIARLGFVPNLNAGTLASRRSRVVGALVPTLSNAWFADTMDGLSARLSAAGYQLLLGQTRYDANEEERLVDAFIGRRVDAIVVTGTQHLPPVQAKLQRAGIPVIECWDLIDTPIDTVVGFSNADAGATMAGHLTGRGCQQLGFIGADEPRSAQRLRGFREAAKAAGVSNIHVHLVMPPSSIHDGVHGLEALVHAHPSLDGVFCSNDTLALGALLAARNHGWRVPEDIAVAGFSDLPVAIASVPALTTIRIDSRALGEHAGDLLARRLRGASNDGQRVHDLGFTLVVRDSA
ncbi:LacI family transcriptional regulator [Burkholderia multivorans]|uniref:LacI family DNA-binding transcriptional regulator n=1 Tax=Burkholderia multivorans TaxID=87883 RepID=UPI000CFFDB76|nr:LacI family DNA-binding transcriptional regulator [Burkholderia multivorans]PRF32612.1 LacI family transcriptional regulator [Burkholderia multivorans]